MSMEVFRALGNRTRWAVVSQLRMGPKSVVQITEGINNRRLRPGQKRIKVSRPAVSQALRILLNTGVLKSYPRGRQTFYGLNRQTMQSLEEVFEGLERVARLYGDSVPGDDDR